MLLEALRLRDFRNLECVQLTPDRRFNIITGQNGQGKTNLLEAIYLLSAVKSFRGQSTNRNLVRFGADETLLEARVRRGGHSRRIQINISPGGKKVALDGQSVRNLSEFFGTLNVVVFGPDDIGVLKGSPSGRRRFVDRAIFNAHPAYATESTHYEDVLQHRNALLKQSSLDRELLSVYNDQFAQWGAKILRRRIDFIEHFRPVFQPIFEAVFGAELEADIGYDATWMAGRIDAEKALSDDQYLTTLVAQSLQRTADEERERGYTVVGPHRDDLDTTLNGRDVRAFGSQGQTRAFILAMKIAEITYLEQRYHFAPILLLDDVSSELDRQRNRHLFSFLTDRCRGQVFITTTHRDYILLEDEQSSLFCVDDGQVTEAD